MGKADPSQVCASIRGEVQCMASAPGLKGPQQEWRFSDRAWHLPAVSLSLSTDEHGAPGGAATSPRKSRCTKVALGSPATQPLSSQLG